MFDRNTTYQTQDPKVMMQTFCNLYKSLYEANPPPDPHAIDHYLDTLSLPRLSAEEKDKLQTPLDASAMAQAIRTCNKDSAPGPDGLILSLYSSFSHILCPILVQWALAAQNEGHFGASRTTFTRVIPKEKGTTDPRNFRPLSLMNVDLKIVMTALNNQAKHLIDKIIHPDQTGFLRGRSYLRNIAAVQMALDQDGMEESTHLYNYGAKISTSSLHPQYVNLLSLDFEKAYDRPYRLYLFATLERMNFPQEWIQLVKASLSNTSSCILLNGFISEPFEVQTGVRQGDPPSPLLFSILLEPLLCAIRATKYGPSTSPANRISTTTKPDLLTEEQFSLAAFADDVAVALTSQEDLQRVWTAITAFELATRSRLNS